MWTVTISSLKIRWVRQLTDFSLCCWSLQEEFNHCSFKNKCRDWINSDLYSLDSTTIWRFPCCLHWISQILLFMRLQHSFSNPWASIHRITDLPCLWLPWQNSAQLKWYLENAPHLQRRIPHNRWIQRSRTLKTIISQHHVNLDSWLINPRRHHMCPSKWPTSPQLSYLYPISTDLKTRLKATSDMWATSPWSNSRSSSHLEPCQWSQVTYDHQF